MASAAPQLRDERRGRRKAVVEAGLIMVEMNPVGFGLMLNVSRTGMAVYTLNRVQPGQQVQISFTPPRSSEKIEAIARISWTVDGNAGMHIHKIRRDSLDAMNSWIASLPELPSPSEGASQRGRRPLFETQIRAIEADIRVGRLKTDDALQLVAERMMPLTKASGAAIAIGTAENMICRGSAGLAPGIGTAISSESGLTSQCISSGKTIRCDDTETDARVDRDACRELNLRSSLIVPVRFSTEVRGVLEVFSPQEKAFEEAHVLLLERLADLTSQLVYGRPPAHAVPPPVATEAAGPTNNEDVIPESESRVEIQRTTPAPVVLEPEPEVFLGVPDALRKWLAPAIVFVLVLILVVSWQLLR